jgi:hypothetical protein
MYCHSYAAHLVQLWMYDRAYRTILSELVSFIIIAQSGPHTFNFVLSTVHQNKKWNNTATIFKMKNYRTIHFIIVSNTYLFRTSNIHQSMQHISQGDIEKH